MKKGFPTILLAWLTAGTLDISGACIQYFIKTGKGPGGVLRFVASGVFGRSALSGGNAMAAWGLLFHFLIAFLFTLFFFLVYPWLGVLVKNKILAGLLYGAFVWTVMNLAVVPLSNAPHLPLTFQRASIAMAILMVCIGLPVSLIIGTYYQKKKAGL